MLSVVTELLGTYDPCRMVQYITRWGPKQVPDKLSCLFLSSLSFFFFFSSKSLEKVPKPEAFGAPANRTRPYMSFRFTNFTRNPTIQLTAVALPDD